MNKKITSIEVLNDQEVEVYNLSVCEDESYTVNGYSVHNCEAFLYWAFQYMATQGDYEIQPETRAPKRNNTTLSGGLCKHLIATVYNLYNNRNMQESISKDIDNYLRMLAGLDYEDYQQLNHAKQIQQQNRSVKWKNKPSDFMNEYFARQAKSHEFLDDHDIKKSLKKEMNKFIHSNPYGSVDDFLRDYFQMTKKAFADDMKVPEDSIDDYFNELGFEEKTHKWQEKREAKNNPPTVEDEPEVMEDTGEEDTEDTTSDEILPERTSILDKDSEQDNGTIIKEYNESQEVTEYFTKEEAKQKYDEYLNGHISNVQAALELLSRLDIQFVDDNLSELRTICSEHDKSKYDELEYIPYLHHFYPTCEEEANKSEEYDLATMHHVQNNKHHWNCLAWIDPVTGKLNDNIDEQEYKLYTVERCCDWLAMAYQHGEPPTEYFNKHKDEIIQPDYGLDLMTEILNKVPDDFKLIFKITRGALDESEKILTKEDIIEYEYWAPDGYYMIDLKDGYYDPANNSYIREKTKKEAYRILQQILDYENKVGANK